jgi:hypothetical protein
MIINLQIGIWQGYRLDKEASKRVTQEAQADDDAARVNKHLVPKDALKVINSAGSALRAHAYRMSLAWKDNGDRILTRKAYTAFIEEHSRLRDAFFAAVDEFLDRDYPAAMSRAAFRMGGLFNATDYPSVSELRHKFYVHLDIDPVQTAGDFRVTMLDEQADVIKEGIERAMGERVNRAMRDVWDRLAKAVENFAVRMAGDSYFKDATIENIKEIVELLPSLNVLEDPELDRIAKQVSSVLLKCDAKELRADKILREQMSDEARQIMDDMHGFMNAFKHAA